MSSPPPEETPTIYRWRDGSEVKLKLSVYPRANILNGVTVLSDEGVVEFAMSVPGQWATVYLSPSIADHPIVSVQDPSVNLFRSMPASKVRGFVYDLGADRYLPYSRNLLLSLGRSRVNGLLPTPRWVSDEVWARRYELAKEYVFGELGKTPTSVLIDAESRPLYLGFVLGLTIETETSGLGTKWHANTRISDPQHHWVGATLEELIDTLLADEQIRPKTGKSNDPVLHTALGQVDWEVVNVERGEFVLPDPSEVELYRALGETLPFFWSYERVREWLEDALQQADA